MPSREFSRKRRDSAESRYDLTSHGRKNKKRRIIPVTFARNSIVNASCSQIASALRRTESLSLWITAIWIISINYR